jgi:hypothetical protein
MNLTEMNIRKRLCSDITDVTEENDCMKPIDLSSKRKRLLTDTTSYTSAFDSYSPLSLSTSPLSTASLSSTTTSSSKQSSCTYSNGIGNILSMSLHAATLSMANKTKSTAQSLFKFNSATMKKYLTDRNDTCVVIINAKVAQKSYGNEKR